jgi:hypothetical protein
MSHILRYIFVIAVAYDGRRLGAGKVTLKASLSSTTGTGWTAQEVQGYPQVANP